MTIHDVTHVNPERFNALATHPLQSFEWGEFRKKTGIKVVRRLFDKEALQLTIHPLPYLPWNIGYLPKGTMPTEEMVAELISIGKENKCIFIQLEPNVEKSQTPNFSPRVDAGEADKSQINSKILNTKYKILNSARPLFTRYTFILDLTKSEEQLLKEMHPKTRYNIKIAQKHSVEVGEDDSDEAFETYIKLTKETTWRQGFYAHTPEYHKKMWETLRPKMENGKWKMENNTLTSHLFIAKYQQEILTAWILFVFHDTLYYPYGASSSKHRDVMASNLLLWEAIRFGKKLGLKTFDMWGALGPSPDKQDPWYGFHRFKEGFGGKLIEFVGSYDLVINPLVYEFYKLADKTRWLILKAKHMLH